MPVRPSAPVFTDDQWRLIAQRLELSGREHDILECLFAADSEKEIATRLSMSAGTVRTHLKRLHAKLGVHNRLQLVRAVIAAVQGRSHE